jgi:hypothetical protein
MKLVDYLKKLPPGGHAVVRTTRGAFYVVILERTCATEYSRKFFLEVIKKYKNAVVLDAEKCIYAVIYSCEDYPFLCTQ